MRKQILAASILIAAAHGAIAETILRVADTETVMAAPDEFAASLQAEAALSTAAAAQSRVNEMMRDALTAARAVDGKPAAEQVSDTGGITVSTGNYGVWRTAAAQGQPERWQAAQTLSLSGANDGAILALVGRLQQKGLVVGSLGWRLSRTAERNARQEATKQALGALRGRVDEAALILGLRFDQFKEVRLDNPARPPLFARTMAAPVSVGMSAATPPNAVPEDVAVTASAEADAVLQPK